MSPDLRLSVKALRRARRHPDFERFYEDFQEVRNGEYGLINYLKFLDGYKLDETKSYEWNSRNRGMAARAYAQSMLDKVTLKSPKHLAIKEQYPMFGEGYWDSFITGFKKRISNRIRLRSDHPVKLKVKGLMGRALNIKFGGEN